MPILIPRLLVMFRAGRGSLRTAAIGGTQLGRASRNAVQLCKEHHCCYRDDQFRARH
jgi:hypothetical protein